MKPNNTYATNSMKMRYKHIVVFVFFFATAGTLSAQHTYTITADSVKITNCDSSELIIENHTQGVPGFLYNTGKGRTQFRRGMLKINNGIYQIGADTLNLAGNVWMQGGNAFGATGVLGTLDNHHLDFYTNNLQRIRLDSAGNLLLGTTTDNGNKLQVNGAASVSGNLNVGTATLTNTGSLVGTNAILFNHFISQYGNYQGTDPYLGQINNVLYNYQNRFVSTNTTDSAGVMHINIDIPASELNGMGITYPAGMMAFSFWNNGIPQSVSVKMYDSASNVWFGPYSTSTNSGNGGAGFFVIPIPGVFNYVTQFNITITPRPGVGINLENIEYAIQNAPGGLLNPLPYVQKSYNEHMYNIFYFRYQGVDYVKLSAVPYQPSYFTNGLLIGSTTVVGSGQLQVTGIGTFTGSVGIGTTNPAAQLHTTGTVRFAGLTNDSLLTRVLVSDANGNLYYRSASSLAGNGILGSSLAGNPTTNNSLTVNGKIRAENLLLKPTGWADYVFAPGYRLPSLFETEQYIQQNKHLPGMPSASEVEKKGIDVGSNQAALLKKIEELTLYAIDQGKRLEAQQAEIASLKEQSKDLQVLKQELSELKRLLTK